jgi:uncharacterized protein (DUF952 family)
MSSPTGTLLHITTPPAWEAAGASGAYRGDTLESEGFIHCSLEHQVLEVANRIFGGRRDLLLLFIDEGRVGPEVRFENLEGGSELYPHVYGPLNSDAVTAVRALVPDDDGVFRSLPEG